MHSLHATRLSDVNRNRLKPGFAFLAEIETNTENRSVFSDRNRNENETDTSFSAENENETNIQDTDQINVM